ncbi:MAG: hypothetical protein HYT87_17050 [Nitrospirae bacterium]|nr:hypothetical protein [Nitrospirota bacterium]
MRHKFRLGVLLAAFLAVFACSSGGSSCNSSCLGSSSSSSTAPAKPLTVKIPSFDVDADGKCDLCNSFDLRIDNTLLDYLNRTLNCLLGKEDRCNYSNPANKDAELNMTKNILAGLVTDLLGGSGDALFEFKFGLDPFIPDMCLALYIEDLDNDGKSLDYTVRELGFKPDMDKKALAVVVDLAPMSADFKFRAPTRTGEADCAVQEGGGPKPDPTDPSQYVADPAKFVTVNAKGNIPNLTLSLALRPLGGDPVSADANGEPLRPLNPGTSLALELPYVKMGTGFNIKLELPSNPDALSKKFASLLPFLELNLKLELTNEFDKAVAKYFGPTPIMDASSLLAGLTGGSGSSLIPGLGGSSSTTSTASTCSASGGIEHPLTKGCITLNLGFNFDFLADCNGKNSGFCDPKTEKGGVELKGGLGIGLDYPKEFNCVLRPPSAAPIITEITPLIFSNQMLGIGLHQDVLSAVMYNALTSGVACIGIDAALVSTLMGSLGSDSSSLGGINPADFFNTDKIGFLWGDLSKAFPNAEVKFSIAPKLVDPKDGRYVQLEDTPTLLIGGKILSANGKEIQSDILARIPHLGFGIQVDVDRAKNYQTAAEVDLGMDLGVGIDVTRKVKNDQGQPIKDSQGNPSWTMVLGIGIENAPDIKAFTFNTEVFDKAKKPPHQFVSDLFGLLIGVVAGLVGEIEVNPNELLGMTLPMFDLIIDPMGDDKDPFPITDDRGNTVADDQDKGDYLGIGLNLLDSENDADTDPDIIGPKDLWNLVTGFLCEADPAKAMDGMCKPILAQLCSLCPQAGTCSTVRAKYCAKPPSGDTVCATLPNPTCPSAAPARQQPIPDYAALEPDTFVQLTDGRFGDRLVLNALETKKAGITTFDSVLDFAGENGAKDFSWKLDFGPWHIYTGDRYAMLPGLYEGLHRLEIKSRSADNIVDASPATLYFRVDSAGPDIRLLGTQNTIVRESPKFTVSVNDVQTPEEKILVSYSLDRNAWSEFSDRRDLKFRDLALGDHELKLRAKDDAENVSEISHPFRVQEDAPGGGGACASIPFGSSAPMGSAVLLLIAPLLWLSRRKLGW